MTKLKVRKTQRNQLERQFKLFFWHFAKQVGLSDDKKIRGIIATKIEEHVRGMIHCVEEVNDNNNGLGMLRGWIAKRRKVNTSENFMHDRTTFTGKMSPEEIPHHFRSFELQILTEFKRYSKLIMNGENVLAPKKCDFRDAEEHYYCGIEIDYGYTYCKDHYPIIQARIKDKVFIVSDHADNTTDTSILYKESPTGNFYIPSKEEVAENVKLRNETLDLLKSTNDEVEIDLSLNDYDPDQHRLIDEEEDLIVDDPDDEQ